MESLFIKLLNNSISAGWLVLAVLLVRLLLKKAPKKFRCALWGLVGHAARYSDTLAQKTLYYALRLSDGSVYMLKWTPFEITRGPFPLAVRA